MESCQPIQRLKDKMKKKKKKKKKRKKKKKKKKNNNNKNAKQYIMLCLLIHGFYILYCVYCSAVKWAGSRIR